MHYATTHNDGPEIRQDAEIRIFTTREAAETYLLSSYDPAEWDHSSARIEPGQWGDAWLKLSQLPDPDCVAPFDLDDVIVQEPGSHPGMSRYYWVTPDIQVLVVASIRERVAEEGI